MTCKDQLRQLVEIQKVDSAIFRLRCLIEEEKQAEADALVKELDAKRATLTAAEAELKKANVEKKALELEVKTKQDAIAKAHLDLMRLKSNDEYHAKLTEIDRAKQAVSDAEDKEIVLFDVISQDEKTLAAEKVAFAALEANTKKAKAALDAEVETLKDELARHDAKRATLFREIDGQFKGEYERLHRAMPGSAVVPYVNETCGGCNMSLPIWYSEKIKTYGEIVRCASCARMLYLEEDL